MAKDDDILWMKIYHIATDSVMALPIWKHSPSLAKALVDGSKFVSRGEAEEINEAMLWREFLDAQLTTRWNIIALQRKGGG